MRLRGAQQLEGAAQMGHGLEQRAQLRVRAAGAQQLRDRGVRFAGAVVVAADARGAFGGLRERPLRERIGDPPVERVRAARAPAALRRRPARRRGRSRTRRPPSVAAGRVRRAARARANGSSSSPESTSFTSSMSKRSPTTAAISSTRFALSGRASMRAATTPHSVSGIRSRAPRERELEARRFAQILRAVAQRARDLLDEERVAAAAQASELGESPASRPPSELRARRRASWLRQRAEASRSTLRRRAPIAGLVVAQRRDDGERARGRLGGQLLHEPARGGVDPLRVVEHDHDGARRRAARASSARSDAATASAARSGFEPRPSSGERQLRRLCRARGSYRPAPQQLAATARRRGARSPRGRRARLRSVAGASARSASITSRDLPMPASPRSSRQRRPLPWQQGPAQLRELGGAADERRQAALPLRAEARAGCFSPSSSNTRTGSLSPRTVRAPRSSELEVAAAPAQSLRSPGSGSARRAPRAARRGRPSGPRRCSRGAARCRSRRPRRGRC